MCGSAPGYVLSRSQLLCLVINRKLNGKLHGTLADHGRLLPMSWLWQKYHYQCQLEAYALTHHWHILLHNRKPVILDNFVTVNGYLQNRYC